MIYKLSVVQEDVSDACNALMHFKECNSYNVNETNQWGDGCGLTSSGSYHSLILSRWGGAWNQDESERTYEFL